MNDGEKKSRQREECGEEIARIQWDKKKKRIQIKIC